MTDGGRCIIMYGKDVNEKIHGISSRSSRCQ